jgi:hypothetical protein
MQVTHATAILKFNPASCVSSPCSKPLTLLSSYIPGNHYAQTVAASLFFGISFFMEGQSYPAGNH